MTITPATNDESVWPLRSDPFLEHHLPGTSTAVRNLRSAIATLNSSFNVDLVKVVRIDGESGAGKNHLARVIAGHRAWLKPGFSEGFQLPLSSYTAALAEISLPALPDSLVESELFGHKKGAFTDAKTERIGLLATDASDILLDEIGDASPAVQAKLLGVIETRQFRKLGASFDEQEETNARFILASHRNLAECVAEGLFREDLYWRASEFVITVPPLRDQSENLGRLIEYQLETLWPSAMYGTESEPGLRGARPQLTSADMDWAATHNWPGNLRQLRHVLVRWLVSGGTVPLHKIAASTESLLIRPSSHSPEGESNVSYGVVERLRRARASGEAVADSLGAFVDQIRKAIETQIVTWYDHDNPTPQDLAILFPGMKQKSVVSKLSQWRTK